jgi:hypothetical protein
MSAASNQTKDSSQPRNPSPLPYKPSPPLNPNKLQFTVFYHSGLGRNHMWIDRKSDKIILIDKKNLIFPNDELTKKNHNYTVAFLAQNAENYHN